MNNTYFDTWTTTTTWPGEGVQATPQAAVSRPSAQTVRDATDGFLLYLSAQGRAEETVKTYRVRLESFAAEYGRWPVADVGPAEVDKWAYEMRRKKVRYDEHPTRPAVKGGVSKATLAGRIQSIKALFSWCERRRLVESSPASHLQNERYDPSAVSRAMTRDDLEAMLSVAHANAEKGQPRDLALLYLFAETGARLGEVASLRLSSLRLDELAATVSGKTGKGEVDFTEATADALRSWLAVRPKCKHDFVFTGFRGRHRTRPLTEEGIYLAFKRIAKKAGVSGRFSPHSVRHLVGQNFTDHGNLELARQKLRHTNITTTAKHYANQDRERLKRATQELSLIG